MRGEPVGRPPGVGWPAGTCVRCPEGSGAHTRLDAGRWPLPLPAMTLAVAFAQQAVLVRIGWSTRFIQSACPGVGPEGCPSWPLPLPGRHVHSLLAATEVAACREPSPRRSGLPTEAGARLTRGPTVRGRRTPLMGFVSKMPLHRHPLCASCPSSLSSSPGEVSCGQDMRSSGLAPVRPPRLRCEPSVPACHSGTPSALAVSHDFGGLLRARGAGLLHPAADHGVRLVAVLAGAIGMSCVQPKLRAAPRDRPARAVA